MSERFRIQDATGVIGDYEPVGKFLGYGTAAPTAGQAGWASGALFLVLGASAKASTLYKNYGSNTSASWLAVDQGENFGALTSLFMRGSGTIYSNILTGANGKQPSATGADKIVDVFAFPASTFDVNLRGFQVNVWGKYANNADTKEVKVILGATNAQPVTVDGSVTVTGGTVIGDTGAIATSGGGGWELMCQIFKTGAAASNTQESMTTSIIFGTTHGGMGTWTDQTFTEANALLLAITLNCTTATTDLTYEGCQIIGFN